MAESTTETNDLDTSVLTPGSASATAVEEAPVEAPRPLAEPAKPDVGGFIWGTGRRKTAVARVRVKPAAEEGQGVVLINGKKYDEYFHELQQHNNCTVALEATKTTGSLDIHATAKGGGKNAQSEAVLLGIARALKGYDPALEVALREAELLTRDPRKVERKKYGQRGARRKFQFSKR